MYFICALASLLAALSSASPFPPQQPSELVERQSNAPSNNNTTPPPNAGGCPPTLKSVTFNGGFHPDMFDTIDAAANWISFGLNAASGGSPKAQAAYIPMMAFASDVAEAVSLVTGPNPPVWMLTFNEPDFSYMDKTPKMSPQEAADAIAPLLKAQTTTKFVAPVTANSDGVWLDQFYVACGCKDFFHAYNIHIYAPTAQQITDTLSTFHAKFTDKPLWLTEVAPGMATPACSLEWDTVKGVMNDVYRFAAGSGFVDRVFWNSGNEIGGGDINVCNSFLLDAGGSPSPLLEHYQAVTCS